MVFGVFNKDKKVELQKELTYERKLKEITYRIHSAPDIDKIIVDLASEILTILDAEKVTIYAIDSSNRNLYSKFKIVEEVKEIRVPLNKKSIAGYVGTMQKVVNINNAYDSEELKAIDPELEFDSSWDLKTGYKTRQILAAPLMFNDQLVGVIQLLNKKNGSRFTSQDISALVEIARTLAVAFYNQYKVIHQKFPKFSYLLSQGILTPGQLTKAWEIGQQKNIPIEKVLIQDFELPKQEVLKALSYFYQCPYQEITEDTTVSPELTKDLQVDYLRKNLWVPIRKEDEKLTVALTDPYDILKIQEIKTILRANAYEFRVALKEDILNLIDKGPSTASIETLLDELSMEERDKVVEVEEETKGVISESDSAIVRLASKIIEDAYLKRASDIHIEPYGIKDATVRFRMDGKLQNYLEIPGSHVRALVSRFKIMANLDIAEKRKPQDGKIKYKLSTGHGLELRVATVPTVAGEDIVMRLLYSGALILIDKIGMFPAVLERFKTLVEKPYGIILVVGPTGSGKTTTLHSAMAYMNTPEKKIWTAEDPVEISQYRLRQVQVLPKIGFTFATIMRAFLRADPDVVMIGEMRDLETASTAIDASLTGHLVLSTIHTNNAPETITRLLKLGIDQFNFADSLLGILAQRLIRKLCEKCKEPYHPSPKEFDRLKRNYGEGFEELGITYDNNFTLYRTKGCDACRETGYKGRMGIFELLVCSERIKDLIYTKARTEEIRKAAMAEGMKTLMQDGIEKVISGLTSVKEVISVCLK